MLEREITPMVLTTEPKRGFMPLGFLKLSLSDAVAQRDQEFGGSASLPRMEVHENDEMATGFYSARGPREFKLNLADNIRTQPKQSHSARTSVDARDAAHPKGQRRPVSGTGSQEGRSKPSRSSLRHGSTSAEQHSGSHGRPRGPSSHAKGSTRDHPGRRPAHVSAVPSSLGSPRHSPRNASHSTSSTSGSSNTQHTSTSNASPADDLASLPPISNNRGPRPNDSITINLHKDQSNEGASTTPAVTSPHRVPSPMPTIFMNPNNDSRLGPLADEHYGSDTPLSPPPISRRGGRSEEDEQDEGAPGTRPANRSADFSGDEESSTDESASETDSSASESSNSSDSTGSSGSEGHEDYPSAKTTTASPQKRNIGTRLAAMSGSGNEAGSSDSTDSDFDAELHSLSSRRRPIVRPKATHNVGISAPHGQINRQPRPKAPRARHPTSSPSAVGPSPLASSFSPDTPNSHFRIRTAPRPKGNHGSLGSDEEDDFHDDEGAYDAPNEGSPRSDDDAITGHAFETYFGPNVTAPRGHASVGGSSPPGSTGAPTSPNSSGVSPRFAHHTGKRSGQHRSGVNYTGSQEDMPGIRTGRNPRTSQDSARKHYSGDSSEGPYSPGKGTKLSPGGSNRSPGRDGGGTLNPDDDEAQLFANTANNRRLKEGAADGDQKFYYDDGVLIGNEDHHMYDSNNSHNEEDEEYEEEEEGEWYDEEGEEYDYEGEDYDDEFDNLSISPGSSAMLMMDGGHEDMHRPIDFETITIEELIRDHNRNPDLLYMIEVSDPLLVNWMCRAEVVKKMIFALCEHFQGLSLEDSSTPGRTYEKDILSSFSYYLITSSPDAVLPAFIIKNSELFDLFFTLTTSEDFRAPPDWTRIVLYMLSKGTTAHLIDDYMHSPMPSTATSELAALSIEPSNAVAKDETRGQYATKVLLRLIGNDNVARLFASLLMPENCAVPWVDIFVSCDLVNLILARFEGLLAQPRAEYSRGGNGPSIASNLTELCVLIASKISTSPLAQQLQGDVFTAKLVDVVCTKEPHPLASNFLTIMCALFDTSYNNGEYETWECPPIIAALLKKKPTATGDEALLPLEYWAFQLDNPTLQIIPPSQLHDPARQPFGVYRLQLLKSVNSLLKTNYGLLHREMFKTKLVTSVMDVLFRHTTASMIHLNVADTIGNVMYFERTEWLLEWLRGYDLIEKVARAFELAASHLIAPTSPSSPALPTTSPAASPSPAHALNDGQKSSPSSATPSASADSASTPLEPKRRPVGYCTQPEYAPHLVSICIKLDRLASSSAPLQLYLSSLPRWDYLFRTFVDPLSKQYRELSDVASLRRTVVPSMIAY